MSDVSRRTVLGAAVGVGGLITLGFGTGDAEAAVPVTVPRRSHYKRSLGRVFTAKRGGRTYRLRLSHIHDLTPTSAKQRPLSFMLVFTPVGNAHLPDAIYVLHSRTVGAHKLFLSSIGTDRGMQAVVNRRG